MLYRILESIDKHFSLNCNICNVFQSQEKPVISNIRYISLTSKDRLMVLQYSNISVYNVSNNFYSYNFAR